MLLEILEGDEIDKFVQPFDMNEFPFRLAAISRLGVVVWVIWIEGRLIDAVFSHNLHDTGNAWNGAVAVVEESKIALKVSATAARSECSSRRCLKRDLPHAWLSCCCEQQSYELRPSLQALFCSSDRRSKI